MELRRFIEGFNLGLNLPMELKNRGWMAMGKCKRILSTVYYDCRYSFQTRQLCEQNQKDATATT
jgi:hypothetical protein